MDGPLFCYHLAFLRRRRTTVIVRADHQTAIVAAAAAVALTLHLVCQVPDLLFPFLGSHFSPLFLLFMKPKSLHTVISCPLIPSYSSFRILPTSPCFHGEKSGWRRRSLIPLSSRSFHLDRSFSILLTQVSWTKSLPPPPFILLCWYIPVQVLLLVTQDTQHSRIQRETFFVYVTAKFKIILDTFFPMCYQVDEFKERLCCLVIFLPHFSFLFLSPYISFIC